VGPVPVDALRLASRPPRWWGAPRVRGRHAPRPRSAAPPLPSGI